MNLAFLSVHKLLLKRFFGWEVQRGQQVILSTFVEVFGVVNDCYSLLLLEWEVLLYLLGHLQT